MKPVNFKDANNKYAGRDLSGDEPVNVESIDSIDVWTDGQQIVSKWKLSVWERIQVALFGHLWVSVLSLKLPPMSISSEREYFQEV